MDVRTRLVRVCGQHWAPPRDHTSCAMPNDLHVSERHAPLVNHEHRHQPGEMRYRYFLGGQVVAGSNPVSPTKVLAGKRWFRRSPGPPRLRSERPGTPTRFGKPNVHSPVICEMTPCRRRLPRCRPRFHLGWSRSAPSRTYQRGAVSVERRPVNRLTACPAGPCDVPATVAKASLVSDDDLVRA